MCEKADPESRGAVENSVKFVKSSHFSAMKNGLTTIDEVQRTLPAWLDRKNCRIHQGTYEIPQRGFEGEEGAAPRPPVPSLWEAAPIDLVEVPVNSQPYVLCSVKMI